MYVVFDVFQDLKQERKKKTTLKKNRSQCDFLAENRRSRLSKSRFSDDHENIIEEDVTNENWKGFEANLIFYLSQFSLLVETEKLESTDSSESEPLIQDIRAKL